MINKITCVYWLRSIDRKPISLSYFDQQNYNVDLPRWNNDLVRYVAEEG